MSLFGDAAPPNYSQVFVNYYNNDVHSLASAHLVPVALAPSVSHARARSAAPLPAHEHAPPSPCLPQLSIDDLEVIEFIKAESPRGGGFVIDMDAELDEACISYIASKDNPFDRNFFTEFKVHNNTIKVTRAQLCEGWAFALNMAHLYNSLLSASEKTVEEGTYHNDVEGMRSAGRFYWGCKQELTIAIVTLRQWEEEHHVPRRWSDVSSAYDLQKLDAFPERLVSFDSHNTRTRMTGVFLEAALLMGITEQHWWRCFSDRDVALICDCMDKLEMGALQLYKFPLGECVPWAVFDAIFSPIPFAELPPVHQF
ncbi:hypothetical protein IAT38_005897 [Cryptococcus sp. DSM 104549]